MDKQSFESLMKQARMVEERSAAVPLAHDYIDYWHGAAFEIMGVRCVASMKEIRKVVDLTNTIKIPGTRQWVRGLANIGGRVLAISDLSAFLTEGKSTSNGKQALVISGRGIHTGLIIDESYGGVKFASQQLRTDQRVPQQLEPYVTGVFSGEDGEYAVFSVERLLNDAGFSQASAVTNLK